MTPAHDTDDFWSFVEANQGEQPQRLRLRYHGRQMPFDVSLAITQIECRQRFGRKLSRTLAANPRLLFPSVLAGEQATSDTLAAWHASLARDGMRVLDCTAGLGIDAMHLARAGASVTAADIDPDKCRALQANAPGVHAVCADCRELLAGAGADSYDLVYIDPARRAADGGRVYALSDCSPDVPSMMPALARVAPRLVVKASPMLDITHTAASIPGTYRVTALGTAQECRELVIEADTRADHGGAYTVQAVTLTAGGEARTFAFTPAEERAAEVSYAMPLVGDTLYEPSPAAMKAGAVKLMGSLHGLAKLHPNTHLYTGTPGAACFPGTAYTIEAVVPYESRHIKRLKKTWPRLCVATRNFGDSAEALRRKLGVADGGDRRLIGVTLADGSRALLIVS